MLFRKCTFSVFKNIKTKFPHADNLSFHDSNPRQAIKNVLETQQKWLNLKYGLPQTL